MPPRQRQPRGIRGPPFFITRFVGSRLFGPVCFLIILFAGPHFLRDDQQRIAAARERRLRKTQQELDEQNKWKQLRTADQQQAAEAEEENKRWKQKREKLDY